MALLQFEGEIRLEFSNCHQICNTSQDGKLPRGKFKVKRKAFSLMCRHKHTIVDNSMLE